MQILRNIPEIKVTNVYCLTLKINLITPLSVKKYKRVLLLNDYRV